MRYFSSVGAGIFEKFDDALAYVKAVVADEGGNLAGGQHHARGVED